MKLGESFKVFIGGGPPSLRFGAAGPAFAA